MVQRNNTSTRWTFGRGDINAPATERPTKFDVPSKQQQTAPNAIPEQQETTQNNQLAQEHQQQETQQEKTQVVSGRPQAMNVTEIQAATTKEDDTTPPWEETPQTPVAPSIPTPQTTTQVTAQEATQEEQEQPTEDQNVNGIDLLDTQETVTEEVAVQEKPTPASEDPAQSEFVDYRALNQNPEGSILQASMPSPRPKERMWTKVSNGFRAFKDELQKSVKAQMSQKNYSGNTITEMAATDARIVEPDEISIGSNIIREAIRQHNNHLLQWITEQTGIEIDINTTYTHPMRLVNQLKRITDTNDYFVYTEKFPVNRASSSQNRKLRIHKGDGIVLHPTQAKGYTADFDGDQVTVHFDPKATFNARGAMTYLIDIDGKPTIDMEFFPIPPIIQSKDDFVEVVKDNVIGDPTKTRINWQSIDVDRVAESFYDVCTFSPSENENRKIEDAWADFIRSIVKASQDSDYRAEDVASMLLGRMYSTAAEIRQINTILTLEDQGSAALEPIYKIPTETAEEGYIKDILLDSAVGKFPPNYQDLVNDLNRFAGDVKDKNPQFRISADIAKLINMEEYMSIGDVSAEKIAKALTTTAYSMVMSNRTRIGEQQAKVAEIIRERVIRECGYPFQSSNLGEWLDRFMDVFKREAGMVRQSQLTFLTDMSIDKTSTKNNNFSGQNYGSIAGALVQVYGQFELGKLFGDHLGFHEKASEFNSNKHKILQGNKIFISYKHISLKDFSMNNRLLFDSKEIRNSRYNKNEVTMATLLMVIADKRTSRASEANQRMLKMLESHIEAINTMMNSDMVITEDLANAIYKFGPEIFDHYNMNNIDDFLESDIYKRMQECKTADELGGVYLAMMADTRFSRVLQAYEVRDQLEQDNENIDHIQEAESQVINEIERLRRTSPAWRTIIDDWKSGGKIWRNLCETKCEGIFKEFNLNSDIKEEDHGKVRTVHSFFYDAPKQSCMASYEDGKWSNFLEFVRDVDVPMEMKTNVMSDIVRAYTKFMGYTSYEMTIQLNTTDNPVFSGSYDMVNLEINEILDKFSVSQDAADRGMKMSYEEMQEQITEARESYGIQLDNYLLELADNPLLRVDVNNEIIGDAITSCLDKSYSNSEKAKQNAVVSVLYNALSFMMSGGLFTDLYRVTDRHMNRVAADKITAQDIIWVLAHPDLTLEVYDEHGRATLSRADLCGDNSMESCWAFLEKHPNIAMALRQHRANVAITKEKECTTYLSAKRDLKDSMSNFDTMDEGYRNRLKVKAMLIDHPAFHAMVAVSQRTRKMSSRVMRKRYASGVENVLDFLISQAMTGHSFHTWDEDKEGSIFISPTMLYGKGQPKETCDQIAADLNKYIARYITDIQELLGGTDAINKKQVKCKYNTKYLKFHPDDSALSMWFDTKQELSGAKTEISTGVEGSITKENQILALYCMGRRDKYAVVDPYDENSWAGLEGAETEFGIKLINQNVDSLAQQALEKYGTESFVVMIPEDSYFVPQDVTLDQNTNRQVPAVGKFFTLMRDNSAEANNLKVKKSGEDGTDSITKSYRFDPKKKFKYMKEWDEDAQAVFNVYKEAPEGFKRLYACMQLANNLQAWSKEMEYNDLTYGDYINVADMFIVEYEDETGPYIDIRSLSELARICQARMYDHIHDDHKGIRDAITEIVETKQEGECDVEGLLKRIQVKSSAQFRPALRARSSSFDRNYFGMQEIIEDLGTRKYKFMANPDVNEMVASYGSKYGRIANRLSGVVYSSVWDAEIEKNLPNIAERQVVTRNEKGEKRYQGSSVNFAYYDFLGFASDKVYDLQNIPGPKTLWYADATLKGDRLRKFLDTAYAYGVTVAFDYGSEILEMSEYADDYIPMRNANGDDVIILPFFDMRINGSTSHNCYTKSGSFQADVSAETWFVEDDVNEFLNGDASMTPMQSFIDRIKVKKDGIFEFDLTQLFGDWLDDHPDTDYNIEIANKADVAQNIVYPDKPAVEITTGVIPQSDRYANNQKSLDNGIKEYINSFSAADDDGILSGQINYQDRIIGWAKLTYIDENKEQKEIWAPLRAFPARGGGAPREYQIKRCVKAFGSNRILMEWKHESDSLVGKIFKVFEGVAAANKMVAMADSVRSNRSLLNGINIDAYYSSATTASRRLGYNKRLQSLNTLMFAARRSPYGYNFIENENSFPNLDPEIKQEFASEHKTLSEWKKILPEDQIASYDFYVPEMESKEEFEKARRINQFLRNQVGKCYRYGISPSDFLASHFQGQRSGVYYQFELLFDANPEYQDRLMTWFNMMMPTLCADSSSAIDDETHLFKPDKDGSLLMQVPHEYDGTAYYTWSSVYAGFSFLDRHYSGTNRVQLNSSDQALSSLVTQLFSGMSTDRDTLENFMIQALAPTFGYDEPNQIGFTGDDNGE